jgi:hypothetical protein
MKRTALLIAAFVTTLVGLGLLRARLGGDHPGAGTGQDAREVLKVGYLPVT